MAAVEGDEEPPQAQRQLQTHMTSSSSRRSGCAKAMAMVVEEIIMERRRGEKVSVGGEWRWSGTLAAQCFIAAPPSPLDPDRSTGVTALPLQGNAPHHNVSMNLCTCLTSRL